MPTSQPLARKQVKRSSDKEAEANYEENRV
jgi:hypothetical protein